MYRLGFLLIFLCASVVTRSQTVNFGTHIPIYQKDSATFYISALISGEIMTEFVIDTGSGYVTINSKTIAILEKGGKASFLKEIKAVMANGKEIVVPVYNVTSINLGSNCLIQDIEVAILPGSRRNILGLSALTKTAPFAIDTSPLSLLLSNCSNKA